MEWWMWLAIGLVTYLLIRRVLLNYIVRAMHRKSFQAEYFDVLTNPAYKVKGSYEE